MERYIKAVGRSVVDEAVEAEETNELDNVAVPLGLGAVNPLPLGQDRTILEHLLLVQGRPAAVDKLRGVAGAVFKESGNLYQM